MKQGIKIISILIIGLFITNVVFAQKGVDMRRGGVSGDPQSKINAPSNADISTKTNHKLLNDCKTEDLKQHLSNNQIVTLYDMSKKKSTDAKVRIDKSGNFFFDINSPEK